MSRIPELTTITDAERRLLRHTVATLAYRAQKVLRDPPDGFAEYRPSTASRTPLEIVQHLGDLIAWAERMARGEYRWQPGPVGGWAAATERFFHGLSVLDQALAAAPPRTHSAGVIFQGPVADALTHVGQLAMIRGMMGAPVRPESYAKATIEVGRVGVDQAVTRAEFDGDASRPQRKTG